MDMQNYTTPFANTGDTEEFSIDTDPSGKVSLEKGWTELYQLRPEEGGLFILRKVFNQMMKLVSTDTVTWKTQSFPNWIDDKGDGLPYAYPKNAIVKYTDGNIYVSKVDNNTALPTDTNNWVDFETLVNPPVESEVFIKPLSRRNKSLFSKINPHSISIPSGFKVAVNNKVISLTSDYILSLDSDLDAGTKTAGTDYYVYAKSNGDFFLSADKTLTTARLIGGFHYSLVPDGEVATGNKTEADMALLRGINAHTFWDLNFRPLCNPEGMFFANGRWYDIYLTNSEHITNGTSKVATGLKIAGGTLTQGRLFPKIPLQYGGDNSLNYGKLTWLQAIEIAKSHKKDMISYSEFPTIAYGVVEGTDASSLDGGDAKIEHYPTLMSKYGMEQATGVQWIWAKDVTSAGGSAWQNVLGGRGQFYGSGYCGRLGGDRGTGVNEGSRASAWNYVVWGTDWSLGCRFACSHLMLD